jgi:hypothetical protein
VGEHPVHHLPPVHRLNTLPRGVQVKDTKPGAGAAAPGFVGIPPDAGAHRDTDGRRPGRRRAASTTVTQPLRDLAGEGGPERRRDVSLPPGMKQQRDGDPRRDHGDRPAPHQRVAGSLHPRIEVPTHTNRPRFSDQKPGRFTAPDRRFPAATPDRDQRLPNTVTTPAQPGRHGVTRQSGLPIALSEIMKALGDER